jgi:triacylglycerol esterase/lipase EstA (alpha/beta hydrolase family)
LFQGLNMLARLLRRILLIQVISGAALGWILATLGWMPLWLALVFPLLFPVLGLVFATVWTCAHSRGKEPAGLWWRSFMGESWAGIQIFLLRQPWSRESPRLLPATSTTPRIPVVLVHGFLCNHRIWDDLARTLRERGHTVFAVNLEPLFGSIDNYPAIVEEAVANLRNHTGQNQVALVGHSMGGLAIRAWMRTYGPQHAARVLTLGTPHWGTQAFMPLPTTNSQQMQWQSRWLKSLAESETPAVRQLKRIALTPQDNIVFPQREQTLEGVTPVIFEGIGHLQMCTAPQVIAWVAEELAQCAPASSAQ